MRQSFIIAALGAALAAATPAPAAQNATSPESARTLDELEAVLVTGERPGPALWKVTRKGRDNVLWILPTFEPLPDGLVLRSRQLEQVISESQEVHFFRQINRPAYLENDETAKRAQRTSPGTQLADVVSAELYARFRELADGYASGSVMIDNMRPIAAAEWLRAMMMRRLHLTDRVIGTTINELARKHNVPMFGVKMKHDEVWDRMYAQLDRIPREKDAPCAKAMLDALEGNLRDAVDRANAWSKGDIKALRSDEGLYDSLKGPEVCNDYLEDIKVGQVQQNALRRFSYSESVKYLRKQRSTLVVVPISILFERNGLITRLKRAGYKVEERPSLPDMAAEE